MTGARYRARVTVAGPLGRQTLPAVALASAATELGALRGAWRVLAPLTGGAVVSLVVERRSGRRWVEVARRLPFGRRWVWAALVDELAVRRAA